jgi:DNA polymerase III delta' subunit
MSCFSKIIGNEKTKTSLSVMVKEDKLPHAILICGIPGSGKNTIAKNLAMAMNCERRESGTFPCGECRNCKRINEDNHPDVKFLKRREGKMSIGVEELRDFKDDSYLSATESSYKFYIIHDADSMTPQSQNALLKILEEPPKGVHIILLASSPDKLLSTIKSRVQLIRTESLTAAEMEKHLASISDKASLLSRTNPKGLREIILASDGSVGYALGMLESDSFEEKEKEREEILTLLSLLPKRTPYFKLYSYLITLPQKRDEIRCILELAERALGDLLTMNYSEDKERSFFLSGEEAEPFSQIGAKRCAAILSLIDGAISDLDKNALVPPLISDLAVKIHEA